MKTTTRALAVALVVAASSVGVKAEEAAVTRGSIRGTGTQYVNTGYTVSADTVLEMNFDGWTKEDLRILFGYGRYDKNSYLIVQQSGSFSFWHLNKYLAAASASSRYFVHVEKNFSYMGKDGGFSAVVATNDNSVIDPKPLYVFKNGPNDNTRKNGIFNLYDLRMWDRKGGSLVRDFVPCRHADGRIGLYDRVESEFHPNAGTDAFEVSGSVCSFDGSNLTLPSDVWSCKDDTLAGYVIDGAVTVAGGTRLELEIGGVSCDSITAKAFVLNASSENPVVLTVDQVKDGFISTGRSRRLLVSGLFTDADLAKFRLETSLPLTLAVENGDIVLKVNGVLPVGFRTVRYIRSTGTQYVLTGIDGEPSTQVELDFGDVRKDGNPDGTAMIGDQGWSSKRFILMYQRGVYGFFGNSTHMGTYYAGADCHFVCGGGKVSMVQQAYQRVDGKDLNEITASKKELAIFGLNSDRGRNSSMRLYRMVIKDGEGNLQRDFRPCVMADGRIGLWDLASSSFFGNNGTGRFLLPGEDDGQYPLAYIESTGSQCVDTVYVKPKKEWVLETHFGHWKHVSDAVLFGLNWYNSQAYLLLDQGDHFAYYGNPRKLLLPTTNANPDQKDYFLHLEAKNIVMTNATESVTNTAEANDISTSANSSLMIFAMWNGSGIYKYSQCRLYDLTLWSSNETFVANQPLHAYTPSYSAACDAAGLYDSVDAYFLPNKGTGRFLYPETFISKTDGDKLLVPGGAITAADVPDGKSVVLANAGTLDSTGLLGYSALTLDAGTFSLKNGLADTCAVSGTLSIAGGVTLDLDVTDNLCDMLSAGAADLSRASRSNPILVKVDNPSQFDGVAKILSVSGLTNADAEKFVAPGVDKARFKVRSDGLYLKGQTGLFLLVK